LNDPLPRNPARFDLQCDRAGRKMGADRARGNNSFDAMMT
jgi:hypothetical protein